MCDTLKTRSALQVVLFDAASELECKTNGVIVVGVHRGSVFKKTLHITLVKLTDSVLLISCWTAEVRCLNSEMESLTD